MRCIVEYMFLGSDVPASMMVSMNTSAIVMPVPGISTSCGLGNVP